MMTKAKYASCFLILERQTSSVLRSDGIGHKAQITTFNFLIFYLFFTLEVAQDWTRWIPGNMGWMSRTLLDYLRMNKHMQINCCMYLYSFRNFKTVFRWEPALYLVNITLVRVFHSLVIGTLSNLVKQNTVI